MRPSPTRLRSAALPLLALVAAAALPVRALVVLEDGKSQLFVTGNASVAWDSNVFSNADGIDDGYASAGLGLSYERKAGIFSATVVAEWMRTRFDRLRNEDSDQPGLRATLARTRGRLTGRGELGWREGNESDNAANRRTRFTERNGRIELQYPLNKRYSFKATTDYEARNFADPTLFDRLIAGQSFDVFHAYTSKLDLVGGYRLRWTDVTRSFARIDNALLFGAAGRLLPRLDGSVRVGYQWRSVRTAGAEGLGATTAAASVTWVPRNWVNVSLHLTKDFTTTSTALTADSLGFSFDARITTVKQLVVFAGGGAGTYTYFAAATRTRDDDNLYLRLGAEYPITRALKVTAEVLWLRNSSTFAFADYEGRLFNIGLSARY